ncbi:Syntaxin [Schistosoma japonicum]|nr:Syntaxin [Schistosoma japonicum]KAH8860334.1 Syntaxin [Schistosoma japonicum]
MVKDRLPELEARIKVRNNSKPKNNEENDFSQLNSDFFDQVNELHADIDNLQQDINAVDRLQKDILASPQQDSRLDNQLNELTNSIRLRAHKIRSSLKELELQEDGKLLSEMSGKYRLKSSQHAAISRQFVFIMNNYSRLQVDYRDKCKARIRTKLLVAQVSFSEDEVEKMLEKNHTGIFTQAIMAETEAAKRSLSDIEARHADIIRLEKSIQEMRDLFFNVALLVDQQGDLIDQVEYNLNKASDCIVNSKRTLSSTVIRNRKNRRVSERFSPSRIVFSSCEVSFQLTAFHLLHCSSRLWQIDQPV